MFFGNFNVKQAAFNVLKYAAPLSLAIPVCIASTADNQPQTTQALSFKVAKTVTEETLPDGLHDYDFFSGKKWTIHGRKRVGRFRGSNQWEEMDGFENSRRIGDQGMIEEVTFPAWRPGFKLVILRLYDPVTRRWAIYDANSPREALSPPLWGSFHQGLGIFVGDDEIGGVPVKVRYTWTADAVHPRYQQEFSNDGGKTWEIDWNMEFTQAKD
jgi:hypothetical protein